MDRIYCTLAEIVSDLELDGVKDEAKVMGFIRAASQVIDKRGHFIPITETRTYDGNCRQTLWVDPLLALTSLTEDGTAIASGDYHLYPLNRHWLKGPYTSIELDDRSAWTAEEQGVVIAGRWGLYENTTTTSATVLSDQNTLTDLLLSSSGLLSPGMVLKIDDEQMLVESTGSPTLNAANTAEALDNSEEEIDLDDASDIEIGEVIRIDFEQMKVMDIVTNTLLVVRGWNGTRKTTHVTSTDVYVYRSFAVTRGINGTTAVAHTANTAVSRYVPPDDVNYLCRQIAGLMLKKSQSGWAGKVGNAELGEVFYVNEFPKDPLKEIMKNYRIVRL